MKRTWMVKLLVTPIFFLVACAPREADNDLVFKYSEWDTGRIQTAYESGELSSEDLVQAFIDEIHRKDSTLRAVIELNPDALEIARNLDKERASGNVRSPLHGIPVLLKDNIDTADKMLTTAGSLALLEAPTPATDAFLVQQLRKAGAVILGKTNLSEWANFRSSESSSGWSSRGGQTRNPYILDRTPCGSSSGSAVAVAANLTVLAVGTETNGSVVCPSANNGIVGIKPSLGLISRAGVIPIAHSQDTAGPMARSVKDAVLLLNAMVGADPQDAITEGAEFANDYSEFLDVDGLRGKRIGLVNQFRGRNQRIDHLLDDKVKLMREAGAEIIEVDMPTLRQMNQPSFEVLLYEFKHDLNQYLSRRGGSVSSLEDLIAFNLQHEDEAMPFFGQDLFEQANAKGDLTDDAYQQALVDAKLLSGKGGIDAIMDQFQLDALLGPTNGMAWQIDLVNGDSTSNYVSSSSPAAIAGYPAITVPAGFIQELPVGVSFFGRNFSEPVLISMAYAFEQLNQGRRPPKYLASFETDARLIPRVSRSN